MSTNNAQSPQFAKFFKLPLLIFLNCISSSKPVYFLSFVFLFFLPFLLVFCCFDYHHKHNIIHYSRFSHISQNYQKNRLANRFVYVHFIISSCPLIRLFLFSLENSLCHLFSSHNHIFRQFRQIATH